MRCDNCNDDVDFLIPIKRSYESYREGLDEYRTMHSEDYWCPKCFNNEVNKIKWTDRD